MGPMVYRPYPRSLESLTVCRCVYKDADVFTKTALSPQLFKDPECWSSRDLNQQPPARQTGAYPTELTGRWCFIEEQGEVEENPLLLHSKFLNQ